MLIRTQSRRVLAAVLVGIAATSITFGRLATASPSPQDRAAAQARLEDLTAELDAIVADYEAARARLDAVEAELAAVESEVRALARGMVGEQDAAVALARELYMSGTTVTALESVLSSETVSEIDVNLTYLEMSSERHAELFEELSVKRQTILRRLEALRAARAAQEDVVAQIERLQIQVQAKAVVLRDQVALLDAAAATAAESAASTAESTVVAPPAPPVPGPPYSADWDAIAQCESGGNWHLDSTYDGGLQFHPMTWLGHGGGVYADYAWQATKAQQIAIAEKVLASQGPGAWPHCYQEL